MKKNLFVAFIALFAAIIAVSGFIKIPVGPVPVVLQNALCVLCGILIGGIFAGAPTALYLVAGLIGLPVYSGGTSGFAVWLGPTGGFLPGYLLGGIIAGLIAGKPSVEEKKFSVKIFIRILLAMISGMVIMYIPGVVHFSRWAVAGGKVPADKTLMAYTMGCCVTPFIFAEIIKIIIAVPVALKVRPMLAQYLYSEKKEETSEEK